MEFCLPFIRFAASVLFAPGAYGAYRRQLYDHEFVYVLEGTGFIVLDGKRHRAEGDDLFLVQPRVWHSFQAASEGPMRVIGVHFDWVPLPDGGQFTEFIAATPPDRPHLFRQPRSVPGWDLASRPFLRLQGRPGVRRMLEDVCKEYAKRDAEARDLAGALLAGAILQMSRECRLLDELGSSGVGPDAMRRVQRARDLLEAVGEKPPGVAEVAEQVGWTADHLRRMFRAVLNTSPQTVQTQSRLRQARELLRYGTLPVAEVALRCGFHDSSHFARVFKAETGHTPRQWQAILQDDRAARKP